MYFERFYQFSVHVTAATDLQNHTMLNTNETDAILENYTRKGTWDTSGASSAVYTNILPSLINTWEESIGN